jgi:hypothetical protein
MIQSWEWLERLLQGSTGRFAARVIVRVIGLLLIFNALYLAVGPFEARGRLPTLYNSLFPGRLRLAWESPDLSAYMVSELRIPRLLEDHIIARPKAPDEYRVVVLGSSDMWGYMNRPQDPMPVALDNLRLLTPDGRQVRSYNLAYVYPDAFKDLLILHYLLVDGYLPDLVILVANSYSFKPPVETHWLAVENADVALGLIQQYGLTGIPLGEISAEVELSPGWLRHSFLGEREDIAYWLINQAFGLTWADTGMDYILPAEIPTQTALGGEEEWHNVRPNILEAFLGITGSYGIPFVLVSAPVNYSVPAYQEWLAERAETLGILLLDCSALLPPQEFSDMPIHLTAQGHRLLAEQVAAWLQTVWEMPTSGSGQTVTRCPAQPAG